ncbi:actin-binding FH2 [Backusella circina FSU 941]|nr:actin-binding FH2 [Backusella circina FSU 941]
MASFKLGSAEFQLAKQNSMPSENRINQLFDDMLERRGIHDEDTKSHMENWTVEKKWLMIHQDHQAEFLASGGANTQRYKVAQRASMDLSRLSLDGSSRFAENPILQGSSSIHHQNSPLVPTKLKSLQIPRKIYELSPVDTIEPLAQVNDTFFDSFAADQNSPEYFVRKFLDPNLRSVTPKIAASLEVSLRTRPITWVTKFIHLKGFHVLAHALDYLNHRSNRNDVPIELEVEVVKCIRAIVNTKMGGKEAIDHPEYIYAIVFSIVCPQWQTQKLVCELLAFVCYLNGYDHVIRGFELLQKYKKCLGLFDLWMRGLDEMTNTPQKLKDHLTEYVLANMILVNALTKVPDDIGYRVYMRDQLKTAGLESSIIPKLETLGSNLIMKQIETYKAATETNLEAYSDHADEFPESDQPQELFENVLESISDSEKSEMYLVSIIKYLLKIKGDSETKSYFYRIISIIIQQIVKDRRSHKQTDDFTSNFGISVANLIQNFRDLDRLKQLESESQISKEKFETLRKERDELQIEVEQLRILPSQFEFYQQKKRNRFLRRENDSLRDVLRTSKETISMLQKKISGHESVSDKKNQLPAIYSIPILNISPNSRELRRAPQKKLKTFQWQKLEYQKISDTLWSDDRFDKLELADEEFDKLETLFFAKTNTFFEKRSKKKLAERPKIQFLTKDKSRNISKSFMCFIDIPFTKTLLDIAILPKIKRFGSFQDVRRHILAMDDKLCTEIFLINLISCIPNHTDNLNRMSSYLKEKDCKELDLPEQFAIEMMRMYRYESRVKFMLFRVQFWEKFQDLRQSLTVVLNASDALRNSTGLQNLLHLILLLGNFMNASSFQGGAFGIRIASINRLSDTKASDASHVTLLHVLVGIVRRQNPEMLDFVTDLETVPEAARIMSSIREIAQQYTEIRHGLQDLGDELDKHWKTLEGSSEDRFYNTMDEYRTSASSRFEELEALYVNVEAKWKDAMSYYGENPKEMDPGEFFSIFSLFLSSWKKANSEEARYRINKENEQKRRKEQEEKKQNKKDELPVNTELEIEDRFLMDKLLNKLRSGETNTKLKERRVRRRKLHRVTNTNSKHHPHKKINTSIDTNTLIRSTSLTSNHSQSSSTSSSSLTPTISAEGLLCTLLQEEERVNRKTEKRIIK